MAGGNRKGLGIFLSCQRSVGGGGVYHSDIQRLLRFVCRRLICCRSFRGQHLWYRLFWYSGCSRRWSRSRGAGSVPSIFGIIVRGRAVDFSLAFLARTIVYQCTPFQDLCDLGSRFRLGRLKGGSREGQEGHGRIDRGGKSACCEACRSGLHGY